MDSRESRKYEDHVVSSNYVYFISGRCLNASSILEIQIYVSFVLKQYFYNSGVIGSLFSLLQFLASPVMGAASDFYGRKPVMIISMVGETVFVIHMITIFK